LRIEADIKFKKVAKALFEGKSIGDASRAAGYDDTASSFEANARKRAAHPAVRAYLGELQKRAAVLAEVDRGYVLSGLREIAEYNLADYLEIGEDGKPRFKLHGLPRELMARLAEASFEPGRYGPKIKIKGYDRNAALGLIARIIGADKDPLAEAVNGIGEALMKAQERAAAAK
jgi:hypothetical protein